MKNLECSNCVIASSPNSNSFLERFDRMNPWRRRRNFKPTKLQNSLVGTNAFIKDSLRQCARLVKAFGTKLFGALFGERQQPGDFRSWGSPQTLPALFIGPFEHVEQFRNLKFAVIRITNIQSTVLSSSEGTAAIHPAFK